MNRPLSARWIPFLFLAGWMMAVAGCATRPTSEDSLRLLPSGAPPAAYMKVSRAGTNVVTLQIAVRQFVPGRGPGPQVWLVGASHVGDSNYFASLQRSLDAMDLVLFEGVGARTRPYRFESEEEGSVQLTMARSLGLKFQLQAIDYDRPHFRNSDLTLAQLSRLVQGGREGAAGDDASGEEARAGRSRAGGGASGRQEFEQLLQVMDGSSFLGAIVQMGFKFIGANPKLRELTKLMLIETLGALTGDLSQMRGLPPGVQRLFEVIIQERDKVVLTDLKAALSGPRPPRVIAVFYGAAHMADLEKRLRSELHYVPQGERWLSAMSVDTERSGLAPAEVEMMRALVKWQLQALEP